MTTFSVIIPAYQASGTIGRALASVQKQTRLPDEVIICDDGSTDDLLNVLLPFRDSVKVVRQDNRGLNAARNTAIQASSGDWVVLLDADDEWLPERLEAIERAISDAEKCIDIVTTDAIIRASGYRDRTVYEMKQWPNATSQPRAIIESGFIFGGAAIRRTAFDRIGGFSLGFPHDGEYEAWIRLILSGSRALLIERPLAIYHQGSGQQLSRSRIGTLLHVLKALDAVSGVHGPEIDRWIRARRVRVRDELARLQCAEGITGRNRRLCADVATRRGSSWRTRVKAAIAVVEPRVAAKLSRK